MYDTTNLLATLQTMSLANHTDTRVKFVTSFFEHERQFNQHGDPREHLSFTFVKSLLLLAVTSDKNLVNCFDNITNTGSAVVDIKAMKDHILDKASLYDGKEGQKKLPTSRNELEVEPTFT